MQRAKDPEAFTAFEHEGWQTSSAGYQKHFTRLTRQTVPPTLDAAGVQAGMRVLDVCAGPGLLAAAAIERGADVVALDFSSEAVAIGRRTVPGAVFRQGDAQDMPFDDDSFDAVACGFGIVHLPTPENALRDMRRVLRPGRRMAVSVWEAPRPTNGYGVLYGAFQAHADMNVPLPHGPDFFQFSAPEVLEAALDAVALRDIGISRVEQTWAMDAPLGIMEAVLEGSVRARGLLLAQTDAVRAAINQDVAAGMRRYQVSADEFAVPMPAFVGVGTK